MCSSKRRTSRFNKHCASSDACGTTGRCASTPQTLLTRRRTLPNVARRRKHTLPPPCLVAPHAHTVLVVRPESCPSPQPRSVRPSKGPSMFAMLRAQRLRRAALRCCLMRRYTALAQSDSETLSAATGPSETGTGSEQDTETGSTEATEATSGDIDRATGATRGDIDRATGATWCDSSVVFGKLYSLC